MTHAVDAYIGIPQRRMHSRGLVLWGWLCLSVPFAAQVQCRDLAEAIPRYSDLASGVWKVRNLPGRDVFTFTIYSTPGELDRLKQLVDVMKKENLGNGFDPGPASRAASKPLFDYLATIGWPVICYPGYADMQIVGGRCKITEQDISALGALDRSGAFAAIQLGEWGYYYHNLSHNEPWWRSVYGEDFESYKHLMKPAGLRGYDERPANRRECYNVVRDYYQSRDRDMRGRSISVTGHSHYEAYAAEWGTPLIGLELGENIAFTQSKLAFARGASRQWNRPWSVQVSPWFSGSCTTNGPLRVDGRYARGLDAGHSLNFYWRMWLHAWFSGTAMVTPENSISIFFENASEPWKLTSHARKAAEFFTFTQHHERGIPYTPVAIVLDHLAGYNAYQGRPWGILEPTPGDVETYDLFQHQLFPGSDHIHVKPDPDNPESSYLRATPFGEMFDVLLSTADADVLSSYPVILLVGDIDFNSAFLGEIKKALSAGSLLLIGRRHTRAIGDDMEDLKAHGRVEELERWVNPATQRSAAISNDRLWRLAQLHMPIEVGGDGIQYQVNRTANGWVIELINNRGIVKMPDRPVIVDESATAEVVLRPRVPTKSVERWEYDQPLDLGESVSVKMGPGEVAFIEFVSPM